MIETKLTELTEAIRQLTVALNMSRSVPAETVTRMTQTVNPPSTPPVAVPVAAPTPAPQPVAEEEEEEEQPEVKVGKITQADLRDAASKLLEQKKLPEILRINREHGIRRITECPEEKYESVHAALVAALANGS